jgi:hypothetical protein
LISGINLSTKFDCARIARTSHGIAPGISSAPAEIPERLASEFRADGASRRVNPAYKDRSSSGYTASTCLTPMVVRLWVSGLKMRE